MTSATSRYPTARSSLWERKRAGSHLPALSCSACSATNLVVRQRSTVQSRFNQGSSIRIIHGCRGGERHPIVPTGRCLGMKADQDHPSNSRFALHDRRGAIRVLGDDAAPSGELRTVRPVLIHLAGAWSGNLDRLGASPKAFIRVRVEPDPIGEIQAVIDGFAAKESSRTNPQIVHPTADDRIVNVGSSSSGQVMANRDRVAARHNQKLEGPQRSFAHGIHLRRVHCRISQALCRKDRFDV
jgi:hypothetical protein